MRACVRWTEWPEQASGFLEGEGAGRPWERWSAGRRPKASLQNPSKAQKTGLGILASAHCDPASVWLVHAWLRKAGTVPSVACARPSHALALPGLQSFALQRGLPLPSP